MEVNERMEITEKTVSQQLGLLKNFLCEGKFHPSKGFTELLQSQ